MPRLHRARASLLSLIFACLIAPLAQAQLITVSATQTVDSTGTPLASGTIQFSPVNNSGAPISYEQNGYGQTIFRPVSAQITNGAFTIKLPDTNHTNPLHVCFDTTITDNGSQQTILHYSCVQPSSVSSTADSGYGWCSTSSTGTTCNFDNYIAAQPEVTVSVAGPAGQSLDPSSTPTVTGLTATSFIEAPSLTITPSDDSHTLGFTCQPSTALYGLPGVCSLNDNTSGILPFVFNTSNDIFFGTIPASGQVSVGGNSALKLYFKATDDPGYTGKDLGSVPTAPELVTPGSMVLNGNLKVTPGAYIIGNYQFPISDTSDNITGNCFGSTDSLNLSGGCGFNDNTANVMKIFFTKAGDIYFNVPKSGGDYTDGVGSPFGISHTGQLVGTAISSLAIGNATQVGGIAAPEISNTARPDMAYWFAALHNCQSQVVRMAMLGDSRFIVDSTVDSTASSTVSVTLENRVSERLRRKLQAACGSHGTGVLPFRWGTVTSGNGWASQGFNLDFYSGTVSNFAATDTNLGPYLGSDAMVLTATTSGAVINFNPSRMLTENGWAVPWDHLACYGVQGPGLNPWTMAIDGTNVGTCGGSASSESAVMALSTAVTSGPHTATLTCPTEPCEAFAMEGVSGTTGVSVDNYSIGSAPLEIQTAAASQYAFLDLNPPQLIVTDHGTNEPGNNISTSTFSTDLGNLVTHAQAYTYPASVLFFIPIQDNISASAYWPIVRSQALSLGVGLADLRDRWGQSTGPAFLFGPDGTHESNAGNGESFSSIWKTVVDILP